MAAQPLVLRLPAPCTIAGDIHGQYFDLLQIFEVGGYPSSNQYLFLGDYVGRGPNSIEVIAYLFCMKIKHPNTIWLLRGNHETDELSRSDGFYDEFRERRMERTWYTVVEVFRWLPIVAVVGRRILCVHGGISPDLKSLSQVEELKRPLDVPEVGILCDLLWADPAPEGNGWQENERGTSVMFGPDVLDDFLNTGKWDLLCRAHQQADNGFDFPFEGKQNCLTIFSAPNYCQRYDNIGAIMKVDADLTCTFEYMMPAKEPRQ
jgi:serine/threonine-protein phosphatase PP1 catalytic subunit